MYIGDADGCELLDWFSNEDLLNVSTVAYHTIDPEELERMSEKAREFNGNSQQLYNWIRTRRKYFTNFLKDHCRSGSGKGIPCFTYSHIFLFFTVRA